MPPPSQKNHLLICDFVFFPKMIFFFSPSFFFHFPVHNCTLKNVDFGLWLSQWLIYPYFFFSCFIRVSTPFEWCTSGFYTHFFTFCPFLFGQMHWKQSVAFQSLIVSLFKYDVMSPPPLNLSPSLLLWTSCDLSSSSPVLTSPTLALSSVAPAALSRCCASSQLFTSIKAAFLLTTSPSAMFYSHSHTHTHSFHRWDDVVHRSVAEALSNLVIYWNLMQCGQEERFIISSRDESYRTHVSQGSDFDNAVVRCRYRCVSVCECVKWSSLARQ